MEIKRLKNPERVLEKSVVSVGVFDGVHLGHKVILERLKEEARKRKLSSTLLTFEPHPASVVNPPIKLLTTTEEKLIFISNSPYSPDWVVVLEFDRSLSHKNPEDFVREYLKGSLGMKVIIEGEDHRFGFGSSGDIELHRKLSAILDYEFIVIPTYYVNGYPVKSGRIRELVAKGELKLAKELLGHNYFLIGKVVEGDKLGRALGFPTANISVDENKLLPNDGVYLVKTMVGSSFYYGLLYIGFRPSIGLKREKRVELNLFDFDKDIYGEQVTVEFIIKLREDKSFDNLDLLKKEMENDKQKALKLLSNV